MPYFDRFDICEAYYVYAADYNISGHTHHPRDKRHRDIMGRLRKIGYKPSPFTTLARNGMSENAWAIYHNLEIITS